MRKFKQKNFSDRQIIDIREKYITEGYTLRELAGLYACDVRTIHKIVHLETYSYVPVSEGYKTRLADRLCM